MLRIMPPYVIRQGLKNMIVATVEMQDTNKDGYISQTLYWLHKEEGANFAKYLIGQVMNVVCTLSLAHKHDKSAYTKYGGVHSCTDRQLL